MANKTKYWITQFALNYGIIEAECDPPCEGYVDVYVGVPYGLAMRETVEVETHAHTTLEAAQAKAEEMRAERIKILESQIEKLKAKVF